MECFNDNIPNECSSFDASPAPTACDPDDFSAQIRIASVAWLNYSESPATLEVPHPADEGDVLPSEWQGKTSVMVRNISYKCTRAVFYNMLKRAGFEDSFDYLYLPVIAGRDTSKGYAFINFSDDATAYRFKVHFDGKKLDMPKANKLIEVIPAKLQGFSENESHYIAKQNELLIESKDIERAEGRQDDCSHQDLETFEDADKTSCSRDQWLGSERDDRTMDILGRSDGHEVMPATLPPSSQSAQHVMQPRELLSASMARYAQLPCTDTKPAGYHQSFSYQQGQNLEHADVSSYPRVQSSGHTCSQCYSEALPGAKFCQWCGARVYGC
eukprot:TRINITY_DN5289_c0_g5_i1.p1 TRINITY_DN5289_c0_g5~~TRINITY_DN5289_c0_g5_i1.p1  ORF type:complete len:328 (+),score=37.32 TRINITY_DN5289_c0_g5_i1:74-1057(+)